MMADDDRARDLDQEHEAALARVRDRGRPTTTTVYAPALTLEQQRAYEAVAEMQAGCSAACSIQVIAYDEDDGVVALVRHTLGDRDHYVKTGVLPRHQGLDFEVIAAFEVIGETLSTLHGGGHGSD